jgi:hypothetical protein
MIRTERLDETLEKSSQLKFCPFLEMYAVEGVSSVTGRALNDG